MNRKDETDKRPLTLDEQQKIHENILCVKGVLDLIMAGITGDFASIETESVQMLLVDSGNKLDEVKNLLFQCAF